MSGDWQQEPERALELVATTLGPHLTKRAELDVLTFWGAHYGGWCTRTAVAPLTRLSRQDIYGALATLVEDGVLQQRQSGDLCLFALAEDDELRSAVMKLARLTPRERRYVIRWATADQQTRTARPRARETAPMAKPGPEE